MIRDATLPNEVVSTANGQAIFGCAASGPPAVCNNAELPAQRRDEHRDRS